MIINVPHVFTLWFGSDFVILSYILYAICICILDLTCNICGRIKAHIHSNISCADIILGHLLIIALLILILDIIFNFLHFTAIVDYADVRITLLRTRVIVTCASIYVALGLTLAILLAVKAQSLKMKWMIYGLFFNVIAFIYFIKSNRMEGGGHESSDKGSDKLST